MKNRALDYWDIAPLQERAKSSLSVSEESPPSPPREAYHYPQVRDALEGNPKGIVSSSPGLRACELPWDIVQTASQPQRGCGRARHPRTQPWHDGTLVHERGFVGLQQRVCVFFPGLQRFALLELTLPARAE